MLCLAVGGLVGAAAVCRFQKALLILATSAIGAAGATPAVALLLAHTGLADKLDALRPGGAYFWVPPAFTLSLFAAGLVVQCRHARARRARELPTALRTSTTIPLMMSHP